MVVSLAVNGCLLDHLRKNRENPYINVEAKHAVRFTPIEKIRIARDVANGMSHLSSKLVNTFCFRQKLVVCFLDQ